MKDFLATRYHLLLLGSALLFGVGSAVYLMMQYFSLETSLKDRGLGTQTPKYNASPLQDAAKASEHLKKPASWNPREDGASPYVSRPYLLKDGMLIDPMESPEPLHPPVPNKWLIDHHLDYADMNILKRDPRRKGFTVLEEFEAGTDPNDPNQSPPLCNKLSYNESGVRKSSYLLEFQGEEESDGRKEILIKPALPLPNPAKSNRPDTAVRGVLRGDSIPGAPFLKVIDVTKKSKIINDTEYDVSELTLKNTLTGESYVLMKKNTSREYKKSPIELVESVKFTYQLTGGNPQTLAAERGQNLTLTNLDDSHTETYKLVDISKDGVSLEKDGKTFIVKPSSPADPGSPTPVPTP